MPACGCLLPPPQPRPVFCEAEAAFSALKKGVGAGSRDPKVKKSAPPQRPGQIRPSLGSPPQPPPVVATPRWHLRGEGGGRREEKRNGEFRSPGSHTEETCVFGEPKRTTSFPSLRTLADRALCPRLHGSGPAVVSPCCFVNSGWRGWNASPAPPRTPLSRPPTSDGALAPDPPLPHEGYLRFGLQFPGCGDLGGVGGGRRCVQGG